MFNLAMHHLLCSKMRHPINSTTRLVELPTLHLVNTMETLPLLSEDGYMSRTDGFNPGLSCQRRNTKTVEMASQRSIFVYEKGTLWKDKKRMVFLHFL